MTMQTQVSANRNDPRIAFFDHHAPRWDQNEPDLPGMLRRLDGLRERLGLVPGLDVLELGCGSGLITGWLAETVRPGRVTSADFSPAMLEQARAKGHAAAYLLMDICRDYPAKAAFDTVLCFQCFPHFRDQPAALRAIAHGLKPGGRLAVLHLIGSRQINAFHRNVGGAVGGDLLPEAEEWTELLSAAGLRFNALDDREDLFLLDATRV